MELLLGNCLDRLKDLEDNSVDAIVTDPPYGLSFMGKKWDYDVPSVDIWKECLRVLKPGGYLLSFAGTRTQHRMAVNIEDAGFEIRDMIAWVYGSGFPKSLNIGKAVDKLQGNEREDLGLKTSASYPDSDGVAHYKNRKQSEGSQVSTGGMPRLTKGTSDWEGWGTALKPALEPITVARKPLGEKTVAENCLKWGVGGINIDGCRVEYQGDSDWKNTFRPSENIDRNCWHRDNNKVARKDVINKQGRFPANLIHDSSDEVVGLFPSNKGAFATVKSGQKGFGGVIYGKYAQAGDDGKTFYGDGLGSASRFFNSDQSYREPNTKASGERKYHGTENHQRTDWH